MRSVHLDRETATDARGSMTTHASGVSLAGGALLSGFQGVCAGRRVLPSANVPRPSGSSFISRRGVPDALRRMSAAVGLEGRALRRVADLLDCFRLGNGNPSRWLNGFGLRCFGCVSTGQASNRQCVRYTAAVLTATRHYQLLTSGRADCAERGIWSKIAYMRQRIEISAASWAIALIRPTAKGRGQALQLSYSGRVALSIHSGHGKLIGGSPHVV
jgi:hypothetical protein